MAKKVKAFQPPGIDPRHIAHRDFVIDRGTRVSKMIRKLKKSPQMKKKFYRDPDSVAESFGINLSDEEIHIIKLVKDTVDLDNIGERLQLEAVGFFDANCKCSMPGF